MTDELLTVDLHNINYTTKKPIKPALTFSVQFLSNEYKDYIDLDKIFIGEDVYLDIKDLQDVIQHLPEANYPITAACYKGKNLIHAVSIDLDNDSVRITRYFENGHFQDYFPSHFGLCKSNYLPKAFLLGENDRAVFV